MEIHNCKADGDLPVDFVKARNQGILSVSTTVGWMLLCPAAEDTCGLNGCTYGYDKNLLND